MNSENHLPRPRVVITGLGAVSPVGNTAEETWQALISGKSGIDLIKSFVTEDFSVKIAAEVKGFDAAQYVTKKQVQRMDRFTQFAVAASLQAFSPPIWPSMKTARWIAALSSAIVFAGCFLSAMRSRYWQSAGPGALAPFSAPR